MRKLIGLTAVAGLAIMAFAQTGGKDLLSGFAKSLNAADELNVSYTVQLLGGSAAQPYKVSLKKPNLARIDTPRELIVADGKTIFTFDKAANTYFKKPQTKEALDTLLATDDMALWGAFFNEKAFSNVAGVKSLGNKNRKGVTLAAVEATMDKNARKVVTLYLDKDNMPKQAEVLNVNTDNSKLTWIVEAKELALGNGAEDTSGSADLYAFKAPQGSRELTEAELNSSRWFQNLDEAFKVAKATNKLVMIDFNATWCGPCQMLKREVFGTEEFKEMGKYFVFVDIDTDHNPGIAKQFNVSGIPDIRFLTADGKEIHKVVGYGGKASFLAEMNKAKSAGGK
ncbi:MAG TPA: thioredoxin domain-containing protein [Fimbriimonadaceae bacterium]|nr:thioredoxin domain-containing protein [Fimbriimonadaceae bacterium]